MPSADGAVPPRGQELGTAVIVADTNLIAYLLLPGPHAARAEKALERDREWVAPVLWRSEFRNVLVLHLRKGVLSLDDAQKLCSEAEELMHDREHDVASDRVLRLCAGSKCSAYDCEFVALAESLRIPLVTTDSQVLRAFPDTAVSLASFAS